MQAKDFYEIGKKAYNGDEDAGRQFFELVAPAAVPIASVYGLLPSYVMAKLVIESGWMTDIWNATAERLTGKTFRKKAQEFNNIFGMNCWDDNQRYLDRLPLPAWTNYRTTFNDWGPHGFGDSFHVKWERWKSYRTVEDAVEDWCANIRYQAEAHGHHWNPADIKAQLLATESYTPEGSAEGVREGLHFQWQEKVMLYYENYGLNKYDEEVETKVGNVKMTVANLDAHIKAAYEFARRNCHYGRVDAHYPPGETGQIDCVGLVFRALFTMGYFPAMISIDQIGEACIKAGMKMSTDINDVWKHHCIVCMQDNNNTGTRHVNHVFYSLGGAGVMDISKYDLGSNERIKASQPFTHVPVNEWKGNREFLCAYYVPDTKRPSVPDFTPGLEKVGKIKKDVGIYDGPGTTWTKLGVLKAGTIVRYGVKVTNDKGNDWRRVVCDGLTGYVFATSVAVSVAFKTYTAKVKGTDGMLAVRVGADAGAYKVAEFPEGSRVTVDGAATDKDGGAWLHVVRGKVRGYASACHIVTAK